SPSTYLLLPHHPAFGRADVSGLRRAVVGGASMPEAVLAAWRERGVEITVGYGLTEAAPNVLVAGRPYPYVEVDLRDGELVVRGPNVFAGYWRNEEATRAAFADGWLLTGDVAERAEDGSYRIAGRRKD